MNTQPSGLLRFFTYFTLKLGNGKQEKSQAVLDINSMCNICVWKIWKSVPLILRSY